MFQFILAAFWSHKHTQYTLHVGEKKHISGKVLFRNVLQIIIITGRHQQMPYVVKKNPPDGHMRLQEGLTSELTSDI